MTVFPLSAAPFEARSRTVEPGSAFDWFRQGWAIFAARSGRWLALTIGVLFVSCVLLWLPAVGKPLLLCLTPLLAAVFLLESHAVASDSELSITGWARVLENRAPSSLAVLGALLLLGAMVIHRLLQLLIGNVTPPPIPSLLSAALPPFADWLVFVALGSLLFLPLLLLFWFAPALVVFHRLRPLAALYASLQACLKNGLPLLVYGMILLTLTFIAVLPAGLGMLILVPVLAGSVYAAYRDIFLAT